MHAPACARGANQAVASLRACNPGAPCRPALRYAPQRPPPAGAAAPPNEIFRVLERMVRLDLAFPAGVALSPECRDLLARMLAPDPARRIRAAEIMAHPWFLANLPPHATAMNEKYLAAAPPPGAQRAAEVLDVLRAGAGAAAGAAAAAAAGAQRAAAAAAADEAAGRAARAAVRAAGSGCGAAAAASVAGAQRPACPCTAATAAAGGRAAAPPGLSRSFGFGLR
jgi:hypothetical protein